MKTVKLHIITITVLFLINSVNISAQSDIRGIVRRESGGTPTEGATITIKGTSNSSVSGADGNYTIGAASGVQITLVATYSGYITIEKTITPVPGVNWMNFWFTPPSLPSDYDGNYYDTVRIGTQTWIAENLVTTHFTDGTNLPYVPGFAAWADLTTPAYGWYNNSYAANKDTYGALYNWYAVEKNGNLCPAGWRVPTDDEWTVMDNYLIANGFNYDNTTTGNKFAKALASAGGWDISDVEGSVGNTDYPAKRNVTGFTGLPGGFLEAVSDPGFGYEGAEGEWWTATEFSSTRAWTRDLFFMNVQEGRWSSNNKKNGLSIRCIKGGIPALATNTVTSVTTQNAQCGGNITSAGVTPVTARGVCWSTAQNPTTADNFTDDGTGTGSFTSSITGLTPNTTYYVRAYATNSTGTAYGPQRNFTTYKADAITDIDGNYYNIVTIGSQVWLAENLKTTRYNDGSPIDLVTDQGIWASTTDPAYCWYENNWAVYGFTYGALYNWYTVETDKLCPTGWLVPTEENWTTLSDYLGGASVAGGKLKEAGNSHWLGPNTAATNETGFTALPVGERYIILGGGFNPIGIAGFFWSATEIDDITARFYHLTNTAGNLYWGYGTKQVGYSVRCLKAEIPVLTTNSVTTITMQTAQSGGNVTGDGGAPVTARGVCWSTVENPTTADSHTNDGAGTGIFTSSITALVPNTTYYVRAYATNSTGTAYGPEVSFTTYKADAVTDIDGNYYNIVTIGSQIWMAENLKATRYNDGTPIPNVTDDAAWASLTSPAYCWHSDSIYFKEIYGGLYNWYTVNTGRLCPTSWHVPSDGEWTALVDLFGGEIIAGGALKSTGTEKWLSPNEGATNESGFTALPGGGRLFNGDFTSIGEAGYWWTSTIYSARAWLRYMSYNSARANKADDSYQYGYSVRCLKDQSLVTNTNDSGVGSFRNALEYSNANPGKDTIVFDIPGTGPFTIQPATTLPEITDPVVIDGYTQPGASRAAANAPASLLIELDGINLPASTGLRISGGNCTVRGLMVNRFGIDGIQLVYGGGNTIEGNYIGVDASGQAKVNQAGALRIAGSHDNLIGGDKPGNRNIMAAGATGGGDLIFMHLPEASNNIIMGNYLGVGPDGETRIGSSQVGIRVNEGAHHNTIGPRNVISGNETSGIQMESIDPYYPNNNLIIGNYIGTNHNGTSAVGNGNGIGIYNATNNIIGGTGQGESNIISGNTNNGILLCDNASGNQVIGNYIGTNYKGTAKLPNLIGVNILRSHDNIIGGTLPGEGNLISGNQEEGIIIHDDGAVPSAYPTESNTISGNLIGTDWSGADSLGNGTYGIRFGNFANNSVIGGTETNAGNIIAFNGKSGINLVGGLAPVTGNAILSNSVYANGDIGIDLGDAAGGDGVTLNDDGDGDDGSNNLQNFPALESVTFSPGTVTVNGNINTFASGTYQLQFFASKAADELKYGEGQTWLGSETIVRGTSGDATFSVSFTIKSSSGKVITATATDADGNTSEFSKIVGGLADQEISGDDWPLHYSYNRAGVTNITNGSDSVAVINSFTTWTGVPTAAVEFINDGHTDVRYASASDNINLVSFTDDHYPWTPGVLAYSAKTTVMDEDGVTARITDADIIINPDFVNSLTGTLGVADEGGTPGYYDIQSVVTHEIGHLLGLLHSGVVNSTMFFWLTYGTTDMRTLEQDDISWVSYKYPVQPAYANTYGSISGNIKYGYNDKPVAGALVTATNTVTNIPVHSYSGADGVYMVPGLLPGPYNIYIEPLDGDVNGYPLEPRNISDYIAGNTIYLDYPGEYYSGTSESSIEDTDLITTVQVSANESQPANGGTIITNKDVTPPEVVSITPGDGSPVKILPDIIIRFSEPVDINSFSDATCYLLSGSVKRFGDYIELGDRSDIILFTPDEPLEYNTQYSLQLIGQIDADHKGITDMKGNCLTGSYPYSITTINGDNIPPAITGIVPEQGADSVFVTASIMVTFSEPMNKESVESGFILSCNGNPDVEGSFAWQNVNTLMTFTPMRSLFEGTTYTIAFSGEIVDLSNNVMNPADPVTFETVPVSAPRIVYMEPADNLTTGVSVKTPVLVDFSEPINPSTVNSATFMLLSGATPVTGSYEFLNGNSSMVFRPYADLEYGQEYEIVLTGGIMDVSPSPLPFDPQQEKDPVTHETWFPAKFTTASEPARPDIYIIDPPLGVAGSRVTISGEGFDPDPAKNLVKFIDIPATVTNATLTSLTVVVPKGALSGMVTVSVNGAVSDPGYYFLVVPQSLDPCEEYVANAPSGNKPRDVATDPNTLMAYVTNSGSNTVSVIDLKTLTTIREILVGESPYKIDINPKGTRAYVTNYESHTVSVIDLTSENGTQYQEIDVIKVGVNPYGIAVTPTGNRVYVSNHSTMNLSVIDVDPNSGGFDHVIANVNTGTKNRDIAVSPDAILVFVAGDNGLTIVNADPGDEKYNTIIANASSGTKTRDVAVTGDAAFAVVSTEDGRLMIIDVFPNSDFFGTVLANVSSGSKIKDVTTSGDRLHIYVTTENNEILVYQMSTGGSGSSGGSYAGAVTLTLHATIPNAGNEGLIIDGKNEILLTIDSDGEKVHVIKICCGPLSPTVAVGNMIITVQSLINNGTILESTGDDLIKKLNDILKQLYANKPKTAVSLLGAFINKVETRMKSGLIPIEQGNALIDAANALIAQLKVPKSTAAEPDFGNFSDQVTPEIITESRLGDIYPNPFSESVTIYYEISGGTKLVSRVLIKIYDLNGRVVITLVDKTMPSGHYSVQWKGDYEQEGTVPYGVYLILFKSDNTEEVRQLIRR